MTMYGDSHLGVKPPLVTAQAERQRCDHCRSFVPLKDSLAHVIEPERWAARVRELRAENLELRSELAALREHHQYRNAR